MSVGKAEARGDGYRELFLRIPEPIFVLEAHTLNILDCNDAACRILSSRRDELIGTEFLKLHGPNDRENAGQTLRDILFHATYRASITGTPSFEHPRRDRKHDHGMARSRCADRGGARGAGTTATGVLPAEVEQLRRAENELRSSEERNRQLVENASDIIYAHDLEGNFTSVSSAAEQITGFSAAEALHMNIGQVVAPEYLEVARETTRRKVQGLRYRVRMSWRS